MLSIHAERYISTILGEKSVLGTCLPPFLLPSLQLTSSTPLTPLCLPQSGMRRHQLVAQTFIYCSSRMRLIHRHEKGLSWLLSLFHLSFPNHSLHISYAPTPHQDCEPCVMLSLLIVHPLLPIPHLPHPRQSSKQKLHKPASSSPNKTSPILSLHLSDILVLLCTMILKKHKRLITSEVSLSCEKETLELQWFVLKGGIVKS